MKPVSPVIPEREDLPEVVYAADQPQYRPLPAIRLVDGKVVTRWELTEAERKLVFEQGYIFLAVNTFNRPLQPVMLCATAPDIIDISDADEAQASDLIPIAASDVPN